MRMLRIPVDICGIKPLNAFVCVVVVSVTIVSTYIIYKQV